jgi:hypothetical protein
MKKQFLLIPLGIVAFLHAGAQSVGPSTLNSTGGSAALSGKTYEWSIGEMTVVNTATASNIIVTQGILQPMPPQTGIRENHLTNQNIKVYPNPAENVVYLQPGFTSSGNLQYSLQNMTGQTIMQKETMLVTGDEKQTLVLESLPAGSYMLSVRFIHAGQLFNTSFKIQKLH